MRIILVGLLSAMPALGIAAPAAGIWRGGWAAGNLGQWKGAPKSDAVKIVQDPVREGKYALRIDGTNAAKRGTLDRIEFPHPPPPPGPAGGPPRPLGARTAS